MRNLLEELESRCLLTANLVADFGGIYPTESITLDGISYFAADDGVHGKELWASDGTPGGTRMLVDLVVGPDGSGVQSFEIVNGKVLFITQTAFNVMALWSTDGTEEGTEKLADLGSNISAFNPPHTTVIGTAGAQRLVFTLDVGNGITFSDDLWSSDGTVGGTIKLGSFDWIEGAIDRFINDEHFELPSTGQHAVFRGDGHLWATDGTISGTVDLSETTPALAGLGATSELVGIGTKVAFLMTTTVQSLWVTDGTAGGTQKVFDFDTSLGTLQGSVEVGLYGVGTKVFTVENFKDNHGAVKAQALWVSDGTPEGSSKLASFNRSTQMYKFFDFNGRTLFSTFDSQHGNELWISDGTPSGTHLVKDLNPGPADSAADQFQILGDDVYFLSSVGPNPGDPYIPDGHWQLWKTDGTEAGTVLVSDLTAFKGEDYSLRMKVAGGKVVIDVRHTTDPHETVIKTIIYDPTRNLIAGPATATTSLNDGVLRVFGTRISDTIRIYNMPADTTRFVVNINGAKRAFGFSAVRKVLIYGYGGNDSIGFKDINGVVVLRSAIFGGTGNDTVYGGHGRDTVFGEQGNDSIATGNSNDIASGGDGDDIVETGAGNDTAKGDGGADYIMGGTGTDLVGGGYDDDDDTLDGGSGADVLFGQAVFDTFFNSGDVSLTDDLLA